MVAHMKWMWRQLFIQETFWSAIALCASQPTIHIEIIRAIDPKLLAMSSICSAFGTIIVNSCFNKWGAKMFKQFAFVQIAKTVIFVIAALLVVLDVCTAKIYFIIEMITASTLVRYVVCSSKRFIRLTYEGEEREKFDVNESIAKAAGTLIGGTIAIIGIPRLAAWIIAIIWTIGICVFYVYVYKKLTNK